MIHNTWRHYRCLFGVAQASHVMAGEILIMNQRPGDTVGKQAARQHSTALRVLIHRPLLLGRSVLPVAT